MFSIIKKQFVLYLEKSISSEVACEDISEKLFVVEGIVYPSASTYKYKQMNQYARFQLVFITQTDIVIDRQW